MKVNNKAQPRLSEDLVVTPPTFSVAILNKERFVKILELESF